VEWTYNRKNFKEIWRMKSAITDALDLKFEPFFERKATTNFIFIYSEVHQLFGRYYGRIRTPFKDYKIDKMIGWAEEHIARW